LLSKITNYLYFLAAVARLSRGSEFSKVIVKHDYMW